MSSVPHLLMVWVIEVCRCSTGLRAGSLGRDGTRLLSAGMLTLRRNAWRRVGCRGKQEGVSVLGVRLHKASQAGEQLAIQHVLHELRQHTLLALAYPDHTLLDHSTRSREGQSVGFAS